MRLAALVLLVSTAALADEPKVTVQAEVVLAHLKPGTVEPGLQPMQRALSQGKKYGALKRVSKEKLAVQTRPTPVPLPSGASAELSLVKLEQGVATIKIKVPHAETTSKLGREGSLYQQAGEWAGGDLWLVLSQPR